MCEERISKWVGLKVFQSAKHLTAFFPHGVKVGKWNDWNK